MAQCVCPTSVRRCVGDALLLPLLLAVRVCSECKGEGRESEGLVPTILRARSVLCLLFYELGLYTGFL